MSRPRDLNVVLNDLDLLVHDIGMAYWALIEIIPRDPKKWNERENAVYYVARALQLQTDRADALVTEAFQLGVWDDKNKAEREGARP